MLKSDVYDGFYRIGLRPTDAPKIGLIFPLNDGENPLLAKPMTVPMGWKNSPPLFCTETETISDLANQALRGHTP